LISNHGLIDYCVAFITHAVQKAQQKASINWNGCHHASGLVFQHFQWSVSKHLFWCNSADKRRGHNYIYKHQTLCWKCKCL